MKLGIYSFQNKLIQAFDTKFQMDDHSEDQVVFGVTRAVNARLALNKYEDLRYLSFYKLGEFDDETGAFVADKKLLLDLDVLIAQYESKKVAKEEEKNGDETNS